MLKKRKEELNKNQCLLDIKSIFTELPAKVAFDVLLVNDLNEEWLPFHSFDCLSLLLSF